MLFKKKERWVSGKRNCVFQSIVALYVRGAGPTLGRGAPLRSLESRTMTVYPTLGLFSELLPPGGRHWWLTKAEDAGQNMDLFFSIQKMEKVSCQQKVPCRNSPDIPLLCAHSPQWLWDAGNSLVIKSLSAKLCTHKERQGLLSWISKKWTRICYFLKYSVSNLGPVHHRPVTTFWSREQKNFKTCDDVLSAETSPFFAVEVVSSALCFSLLLTCVWASRNPDSQGERILPQELGQGFHILLLEDTVLLRFLSRSPWYFHVQILSFFLWPFFLLIKILFIF